MHAIKRFQQRIENIPNDEVVARVLTPKARLLLGMGQERVIDGEFVLIAEKGAVVTILNNGLQKMKAKVRKYRKEARRARKNTNRSRRI